MKTRSRYIIILTLLFGYVLFQFMWWEYLLVKQTGRIIEEEQKLTEITSTNQDQLRKQIDDLHRKKTMQTIMIVGEGTVFLLLLLYGVYKIKQSFDKEAALARQQNNFFLSITHELKTPIAATKLQLQTLQRQQLDETIKNELIANAIAETDRLNLLIDNVLLASSLEKGNLDFVLQRTDLGNEVRAIATRYFKKHLESRELELDTETGLFVNADAGALMSVVTNLVGNAIKYSKTPRKIVVNVIRRNEKILMSVEDNGCGISEYDKPHVFERFYRAGNEETRSAKGTGLGLYIVKYLLDKHFAKITVKSNSPQGSIFETEWHAA